MQAKGHEKIQIDIAQFLKELIQEKFPGKVNDLYGNDANIVNQALYMGNWLTDISQLFAPDTIFELRQDMYSKATDYNAFMDQTFDTLESYLSDYAKNIQVIIVEKILTIKFTYNPEDKSKVYIKQFNSKKLDAEALVKQKYKMLNQNEELKFDIETISQNIQELFSGIGQIGDHIRSYFKISDDTMAMLANKTFETRKQDELWKLTSSVIRLTGYIKFCIDNGMDKGAFKAIMNNYIHQTNTPDGKPEYRFNLNAYYPSDHLDKAFSLAKLAQLKNTDTYSSLKKLYFLEDKINTKKNIYTYLEQYLNIIAGKLTELQLNFINPHFLEGKQLDKQGYKHLIEVSKLGHTLHGLEDFYAHSNYVERVVQNLDKLVEDVNVNEEYFVHNKYFNLLKPHEQTRYYRALNKHFEVGRQVSAEANISTGFFAEGDTTTSLYHMVFEFFEHRLQETNYADYLIGASQKMFKDSVKPYMDKIEPGPIQSTVRLMHGIKDLTTNAKTQDDFREDFRDKYSIDEDIVDFILKGGDNADFGIISMDDDEKALLVDVVNYAVAFALVVKNIKNLRDVFRDLNEIASVFKIAYHILSVLLAPEKTETALMKIIAEIRKLFIKALGETVYAALQAIINKICVDIAMQFLGHVSTYLEKNVLQLDSMERNGSHSILAKDEPYRNEHFHYLAMRMANISDKNILSAMFCTPTVNNKGKVTQIADFNKLIQGITGDPGMPENEILKSKVDQKVYYESHFDFLDTSALTDTIENYYSLGLVSCRPSMFGFYEKEFLRLNKDIPSNFNEKKLQTRILYNPKSTYKKDVNFSNPRLPIEPLYKIAIPFQRESMSYPVRMNRIGPQMKMIANIRNYIKVDTFAQNDSLSIWFFKVKNYMMPPIEKSLSDYIEDYLPLKPIEATDENIFGYYIFAPTIKLWLYPEANIVDTIELNTANYTRISIENAYVDMMKSKNLEQKLKMEYDEFIKQFLAKKYGSK